MRTSKRGSRRRVAFAAATLAVAGSSAAIAAAAPVDVASDQSALKAYDNYLHTVIAHEGAWKANAAAYASKISAQCRNVLAAVNALPSSKVNAGAAVAIGEEIGFDVELSFLKADIPYQAKLQSQLSRLRWSSQATASSIANWQSATSRLFHLAPSTLCADANAFAASAAKTTPPATLSWLNKFERADTAVVAGAKGFEKTVAKYADAADRPVTKDVNKALARVNADGAKLGETETKRLAGVLGLTTP